MKITRIFLAASCVLAMSCNRHHDSAEPYEPLPIIMEHEPVSTILKWGEMTPEERHRYPSEGFMINSSEGFPDDERFFLEDLKASNIDFTTQTLLVSFRILPGYVYGHKLYWMLDNTESAFEFLTHVQLTELPEDDRIEDFTYYRSAITVSKIPDDTEVSFAWSY